jgi:uncharacterized membrane protein YkgB
MGLLLGIALNYVGFLKMVDWFNDEKTASIFAERFLAWIEENKMENQPVILMNVYNPDNNAGLQEALACL